MKKPDPLIQNSRLFVFASLSIANIIKLLSLVCIVVAMPKTAFCQQYGAPKPPTSYFLGKVSHYCIDKAFLYCWNDGKGLFVTNSDKLNFTEIATPDFLDTCVVVGLAAFDGSVFIATLENGLYEVSKGHFTEPVMIPGLSSNALIFSIAANDSAIFLGTESGLFRRKIHHPNFSLVAVLTEKTDSIAGLLHPNEEFVDYSRKSVKTICIENKRIFICLGSGHVLTSIGSGGGWNLFHYFGQPVFGFNLITYKGSYYFKGSLAGLFKVSIIGGAKDEIRLTEEMKFAVTNLFNYSGSLFLYSKKVSYKNLQGSDVAFAPFSFPVPGQVSNSFRFKGRDFLISSEGVFGKY